MDASLLTALTLAGLPDEGLLDPTGPVERLRTEEVRPAETVAVVTGDDTPTATVFFDDVGARCEVLLNADAVGVQTFVAVKVRCRDPRGRVVLASEPNVLMTNGKPATVSTGRSDDAETGVTFRLTVSEQPEVPSAVAVRREVFAKAGDAKYAFYRMRAPWTGLSCEPGEVSVEERQGDLFVTTQGRFATGDVAEARCTAEADGQRVGVPLVIAFL